MGRVAGPPVGVTLALLLGLSIPAGAAALDHAPMAIEADAATATPEPLRPDAERASVEVSTGASEDGAPETDERDDQAIEEIEAVLEDISAAMLAGDPELLATHLDAPDSDTGQAWRRRAANIAGVELTHYRLRVDPRLHDVTTEAVRVRYDRDVRVLVVLEEYAVEGHEEDRRARHRRTLTFVDRDGGWRLAEEADGRALGLATPVHLWDLGPVTTTSNGAVTALHRPDAIGVADLVDQTARGITTLRQRWPVTWSERVLLVVPDDGQELEELLDADLHLDDFLAFATATTHSEPGVHELVGSQVVVNPHRFDDLQGDVRDRVLLHELLHVASRPHGAATLPLWLEEGIAQALGEQGPSTGTTTRLDALGTDGRRLPRDEEFTASGREATHLAYQRSYAFVDHLVRRHGASAVARFYTAAGSAVTGPGTVGHQLDAAAEDVFGADVDELVAAWRAGG